MRTILVQSSDGDFRVQVEDTDKLTFGPFSPPSDKGYGAHANKAVGTLRIYRGNKENIVFCMSGVYGFRDDALSVQKKVVTEEVSTIWQGDDGKYTREEKGQKTVAWLDETPALPADTTPRRRGRK